tara:strand:+ start:3594 stop:5789 length:2196 start_codon:yes stop_codon:yes gene_type:complete
MKKIFFTTSIILFFLLVSLIVILSTIGFETKKFNKFISDKVKENNKNISLKLEKIKFKFDIKDFNLFLETKGPELTYKNLKVPIENIKVYLDSISLIRSKSKIDKINISSKEININQLKDIILKTKPSNLNSLITNKVKNGKVIINLELYFDDNLDIDNFIARGEVKEMSGIINSDLSLKNTSFNFFADSSDILIKNVKSKMDGILIKNGNLQIKRNKEISLKSDFTTEIKINKKNIINYLPFIKNIKFINQEINFNANLDNFLNITFDETFKLTDYAYTNKGRINRLFFKFNKSIKNSFLEKDINNLYFKDSNFNTRYASDKKNYINASGIYSIDDKNYQNYDFKNDFLNKTSNINLDFEFVQKLSIDFINYEKDYDKVAKIFLSIGKKKDLIDLKELKYTENKNLISIKKLRINKKNIISLKEIKVKTFDKNDLKNNFILDFGKKIKISGNKYDAKNLNKFLNQNSKKNILKKISKDVDIDLKNIDTPLSKKLKNFRLIGVMEKGKFVKISSKGDFGNNKFLDISMKNDEKNKRKYLEIYSDLPQPLLSEYTFFKGLSEGILTFSSIIEGSASSSKLIIEDFKVVNAPGVVKLLSLADFGGLADLAEGEGLSFDKLEIKMTNNEEGFLKLEEIFAIGPSISVLMKGYKTPSGLTSLRGTLVPAKNLNKILSKIPVIGKIIIPEEIGEGLFGVSFKMKGPPGKIKTTINPIKTLTPRFITKALEKSKQSK